MAIQRVRKDRGFSVSTNYRARGVGAFGVTSEGGGGAIGDGGESNNYILLENTDVLQLETGDDLITEQ